MTSRFSFTTSLLLATLQVHARKFTVVSEFPSPDLYTDLNVGTAVPDQPTGWDASPGSSVTFDVPDNWKAGRIWGRRDCDFSSGSSDPSTCLTGGCNGGLLCDNRTGTGVPPCSVAEWTLQGDGNRDFYDVSLVDGFDLPMSITNNQNCPEAGCYTDLNPSCPDALKGPSNSSGATLGCKSSCQIDTNQADSPNCCSGSYSTADTCPSSGVAYYDYFKGNCPDSYAYAYDESSGTALFTCDSSLNADYTLVFCPSGSNSSSSSAASSSPSQTTSGGGASASASASDENSATSRGAAVADMVVQLAGVSGLVFVGLAL
ncbi:Osmotin, thaumatin-like protein [Schizophyllum commune Loenen D]|nr:Osmotin, thaumatin-like protein [Schizophyllum commune Loenen D]